MICPVILSTKRTLVMTTVRIHQIFLNGKIIISNENEGLTEEMFIHSFLLL